MTTNLFLQKEAQSGIPVAFCLREGKRGNVNLGYKAKQQAENN